MALTLDTTNCLAGFVRANPGAAAALSLTADEWREVAKAELLHRRVRAVLPLIDDPSLVGIAQGEIDMPAALASIRES
jgi:hypothetical protein